MSTGSHIFAVYSDANHELDECFAFLKDGFDNNEAIWIAEEDLTKDEIRQRIRKEWKIENIEELEARGDITIATSREWYYPDGKFDLDTVVAKWHKAVEDAVARGKKGLRAFDSVDGLLKDGFANDLVAFESVLGTSFKIPFTAICAYKAPDVERTMTAEQFSLLHLSHGLHRNFGYNVLENPHANLHVALMYDTEEQRDFATSKYINEGLRRGQLCIYASVHMRDKAHRNRMASLIDNFEGNIAEGNLLAVDLAPHYVAAMSESLDLFDEVVEEVRRKVANRKDKHVRLAGDCVAFLFKNKHFDECARLEEWWQEKPFEGSYLCPYPTELAKKYPYDIHRFRVLSRHDVISDKDGKVVAAYHSENGFGGKKQ